MLLPSCPREVSFPRPDPQRTHTWGSSPPLPLRISAALQTAGASELSSPHLQSQTCASRSVWVWGAPSSPDFMVRAEPAVVPPSPHLQPSGRMGTGDPHCLVSVSLKAGDLCALRAQSRQVWKGGSNRRPRQSLCAAWKSPKFLPRCVGLRFPIPNMGLVVLPSSATPAPASAVVPQWSDLENRVWGGRAK